MRICSKEYKKLSCVHFLIALVRHQPDQWSIGREDHVALQRYFQLCILYDQTNFTSDAVVMYHVQPQIQHLKMITAMLNARSDPDIVTTGGYTVLYVLYLQEP